MAYYNNPYQNQFFYPQQQMQQIPQQTQPQIQNSGFVSVRSEIEARNYPVAPGNSVMFKIEGQPIVIEKSMGFSQFEAPRIDIYELVKKDTPQGLQNAQSDIQNEGPINTIENDLKAEIEALRHDVDMLKDKIKDLRVKEGEKNDESE